MLVLDASVVLAWAFPDEHSDLADRAIRRVVEEGGSAPSHFPLEVMQALLTAMRRDRITRSDLEIIRRLIAPLPVEVVAIELAASLDLIEQARAHELSIYDVAYLELARARGLEFATVDDRLAKASRSAGVSLVT
jgi:predicted nucleic acid-binding protein